jgi:hypothetical protein
MREKAKKKMEILALEFLPKTILFKIICQPKIIEAVLKAYRMAKPEPPRPGENRRQGAGKVDPPGRRGGDRPGSWPRAGKTGHSLWRDRSMENVQDDFKYRKDDLYSRYRLARPAEEKKAMIRDMQRFNIDARKYRGVIPPLTATSKGQET